MARALTLEEVTGGHGALHIEFRDRRRFPIDRAVYQYENAVGFLKFRTPVLTVSMPGDGYGAEWIALDGRPTEAERDALAWRARA